MNLLAMDLLDSRIHTSQLLGKDSSLVLHGGGNTSVKIKKPDFFGETQHLLYVKGSGWDLATIERAGFAAVKMDVLLKMAQLETLSDSDMVKYQKAAMTEPSMPTPSVEAILHAIIPHAFVDHTHADAIVCVTNTPNGHETIENILGSRFLYLPYTMPGFILAKQVAGFTKDINWENYDGMILMHHGIFTWAESARTAYDKMIAAVTRAEEYIKSKNAFQTLRSKTASAFEPIKIARLRKAVSLAAGTAMVSQTIDTDEARGFAKNEKFLKISQTGGLTPDHVINTKRTPVIVHENIEESVLAYSREYVEYFNRHRSPVHKMLNTAPRWALVPGHGGITFGVTRKRAAVVRDIAIHTMKGWQWSENLGGWKSLPEKDIFEVEYWELEQAKLKGSAPPPLLQGKIALVTGAASGIGRACVEKLAAEGAVVAALDISPKVKEIFTTKDVLPILCDVTSPQEIKTAVDRIVCEFGGLDIIVSNAGTFPASSNIDKTTPETWQSVIDVNLNSHFYLLHECIAYLELGIDPAVIMIGSKNVRAPGPGVAAYSAAKAGLTQLARVAALELGGKGIRVNVIHPNAVFDTGLWTDEVLQGRAKKYGLSVEAYRQNNLLGVEITSPDVAGLVASMAGSVFSKITGAQVGIDGGNDKTL